MVGCRQTSSVVEHLTLTQKDAGSIPAFDIEKSKDRSCGSCKWSNASRGNPKEAGGASQG